MGKASKKKASRRRGTGQARSDVETTAAAKGRVSRSAADVVAQLAATAASIEATGKQAQTALWGGTTPVPATIPNWAEGSLGDYFFTHPSITEAAGLPPLAQAVLPAPEALTADPGCSQATTDLLVRAIVFDGLPASDPAMSPVIDLLSPLVERDIARDPRGDHDDAIRAPLRIIGVAALTEATRSVLADDRIEPVLALLESRLEPVLAPFGLPGATAARALVCAVAHHYLFRDPADTETLNRLDDDSSTTGNPLVTLILEKDLAPENAIRAGLAMLAVLAGLCRTNATSALG